MKVGQIALTVRDLARSVEFYRDQLQVKFVFQAPNMAFFDCAGVRLMLVPGEPTNSIVYFHVEDIQPEVDALKSRGVIFDREPHLVAKMPDHELWMAFLHDPDGNVLGLMCERPREAQAQ